MALRTKAAAVTMMVAAAALVPVPQTAAAEDPPPLSAPAPEATTGLAGLLTRLQALYRDAEAAGETYNATEEELRTLTARTKKLTGDLTRTRDALARSRAAAGRLARAQYQGRMDLSLSLRLLFARDPRQALDQGQVFRRVARQQAAAVKRLESGEKHADGLATASRQALDRQQALLAEQRQARDTAGLRLLEAARALAALSPDQLATLADLEKARTAEAQRELLASADLDGGDRPPSEQGGAALAYAAEQIGKPYELGAAGPDAFDGSGLAFRAWAEAGRPVPRTSQDQWRTLPKVPLTDLRPGDLVLYRPDATHVALYAGQGHVIHAPHPGAPVELTPLAAHPLLGTVRPDPNAESLPQASYTPPPGLAAETSRPDPTTP